MDHLRLSNGEDNIGIPEDLRCKRSDGKQWRCSAMSMPDKTVCEKHYIQAKKRAANSALRASLKKAKRKPYGDDDDGGYLDSRNDEVDGHFMDRGGEFQSGLGTNNFYQDRGGVGGGYSPETIPIRGLSGHGSLVVNDDDRDGDQFDDDSRDYRNPMNSSMELLRNKGPMEFDADALIENSEESTDSSDEEVGLTCHQCQKNDTERVIWCQKCDKRGYCDSCISEWYPDIPLEEVQKVCPVCRGTCNCIACLRGDNLIKFRMREITATSKLQYFHNLLSSILPVVKHIHREQSFELELETRFHGSKTDIPRAKLHADEQMCCNYCRIPIIDYHRHCANCLYDLCLTCCQDLRQVSDVVSNGELAESHASGSSQEGATEMKQPRLSGKRTNIAAFSPDWKANSDGSIPCPPKEAGGCGCSSLILRRIFKMNWVTKLVRNVEEMVDGCKLYDVDNPLQGSSDTKLCQYANRENDDDNFLYCPVSQDFKLEGIHHFQKHWARGEPIIVKEVCDRTSSSNWDPRIIWSGIRETTDEKTQDDNRVVNAIDCLDGSEVGIELGQFIKGYTEGRIHENSWPQMLRLKDWPSPGASEEFLLYQRPEFLSKLPLIEYIHYKWGLLNIAAKLPYYSLQNDVGPKIFMSYGTYEELGRGDSVTNLHTNMRDMVYVLMHTCEVKMKGWQRIQIAKIQKTFREHERSDSLGEEAEAAFGEGSLPLETELNGLGKSENRDEIVDNSFNDNADVLEKAQVGAVWDVFRRQDVTKLIEYLTVHWKELRKPFSTSDESVMYPLFEQAVYLNRDHKKKLKEDFGIEPWTFEQHLGEAVFIPSGCPFQVRNLQSSVQLALDFLSPESVGESLRLGEEIRSLPADHKAKRQMLEVGKMSLYAASYAVKDVQKLVLDPKNGPELGYGDPNLTALVSENLEKMIKRRQIACS